MSILSNIVAGSFMGVGDNDLAGNVAQLNTVVLIAILWFSTINLVTTHVNRHFVIFPNTVDLKCVFDRADF